MDNQLIFATEKLPHSSMEDAQFDFIIVEDEHGFTIQQRDYIAGEIVNVTPCSSQPSLEEAKRTVDEYLAQAQ